MAISGSAVFEVENGGSDTNGGFFVTGASGTDWSMQSSPQYSVTDGVTAGTTTITSATAAFGTDVVGNGIYVQGGTGSVTAGWYQITARGSATSITVDRSTGLTAGTGVTLHIGGAFATPGLGASLMTAAGQIMWIKYSASAYVLTTSSTGAGGILTMAAQQFRVEGYDVTRGDRTGNRPLIQMPPSGVTFGGNTFLISGGASGTVYANIALDGNNITNASGIGAATQRVRTASCTVVNFSAAGSTGINAIGHITRCMANNCTTGFNGAYSSCCTAISCTTGFSAFNEASKCLASACGTGFSCGSAVSNSYCRQCTADNCTVSGFTGFTTESHAFESCIASNNLVGFTVVTVTSMLTCATYGNTTAISGTPQMNYSQVVLSAQPYVSAGTDFRPNSTSGGGLSLRGAGYGVYGQTDNSDIGAVQHSDPSGSGMLYRAPFNW